MKNQIKKTMKIKTLYILSVAVLGISCSSPKQKIDQNGCITLNYKNIKKQKASHYFSTNHLKFIQLESQGIYFLSDMFEIQYFDGNYFTFDFTKQEFLRFNNDGKLLNSISRSGQAEAEFSNAGRFTIDHNNRTLEILSDLDKYIKRYDFDGQYLEKQAVPVRCSGFTKGQHNDYWFYMVIDGSGEHAYRLHYADSNNLVQPHLPLTSKLLGVMEQNFFKSDNSILFRESFFSNIYRLEPNEVIPIIRIDFGKDAVTEATFEEETDPFAFFDRISSMGFHTTTGAVEGNGVLAISCLYQKGESNSRSGIFYDYHEESATLVEFSGDNLGTLLGNSKLVRIDNANNIYFITDALSFREYLSVQDIASTGKLSDDGNHVIFSFQIKR